ncbi:MAG: FHA domain-containing protein, partial [Acidimicrobiales bacterium]
PAAGADARADATLAGSAEAGGRRVQLVPGPAPEPVVVPVVVCGDGHLNPPGAEVCTVCGAGVDEGQTPSEAPRPSLGALRFDNGATFALDATVFLGRDPEADPEVADMVQRGAARALSLEDEDRTISRVHAEIRLSGWEVQAVDRSVNGTLVLPPGSSEWSRLMPQTVTPLEAGARILIGGHAFTVVERAD